MTVEMSMPIFKFLIVTSFWEALWSDERTESNGRKGLTGPLCSSFGHDARRWKGESRVVTVTFV